MYSVHIYITFCSFSVTGSTTLFTVLLLWGLVGHAGYVSLGCCYVFSSHVYPFLFVQSVTGSTTLFTALLRWLCISRMLLCIQFTCISLPVRSECDWQHDAVHSPATQVPWPGCGCHLQVRGWKKHPAQVRRSSSAGTTCHHNIAFLFFVFLDPLRSPPLPW